MAIAIVLCVGVYFYSESKQKESVQAAAMEKLQQRQDSLANAAQKATERAEAAKAEATAAKAQADASAAKLRSEQNARRYPAYAYSPTDGFANIRATASMRGDIVAVAYDYDRFYVSKTGGKWWKVYRSAEGSSFVGYIHRSLVVLE